MKCCRWLLAGLLPLGVLTTSASALASAPPPYRGAIKNVATNRCLDSNYRGQVYTLPCNGGNYQKWDRVPYHHIRNVQTGRCLDSNFRGNVYTLPCAGDANAHQTWHSAGWTIYDAADGRCLDSNFRGNVYTLPGNGGDYQSWYSKFMGR